MDGNPVHFVKQHPYAVAGVVFVIGAFILYEYYGSSSGGSGTAVVATPADNSGLAAAVQLSGQQTALTAQNNTLATQLQALQIQSDAQTQQQANQVQGQVDLAKIQSDAAKQQSADQLTSNLAEYQAQSTIQALGITSQKDIADTAAATQLAALQTQAAEQESISQSAAATQVGLASLSAAISAKQIDAASAAHTQDVNLQAYQIGTAGNVASEQINEQYGVAQLQHDYAVQQLPYQQDALARVINYNETLAGWNEQIAQYGITYGNQTAQVLGSDAIAQAQAAASGAVGVAQANASAAAGNTTGGILSGAGTLAGGLGGLVKTIGALF